MGADASAQVVGSLPRPPPDGALRMSRIVAASITAVVVATTLVLASDGARDARAADPVPDFSYFKERIEPVLQQVCAQCHAGKGKGGLGLIVHALGAPFPDAEHRVNYATALKLVVPGKPDQSKFLLKPLAERDGGTKHEGGDRIFKNTPAYKAWVDFINGVKGETPSMPAPAAPTSAPGQPDLGLFMARVEPVLLGVCSRCHAGTGKGQFALIVHEGGTRFPLADHRKNYDTVTRLLVPGKPESSKFLLKPLAERDGGTKHTGGDLITKGDANYRSWVDFINGVKGPPVPEDAPAEEELPAADAKGLVLEAESLKSSGDVSIVTTDGGSKVAAPGPAGGRLTGRFRASRAGDFQLEFRTIAATRGMRLRIDGGEPLDVEVIGQGALVVTPRIPLDGGKPLDARLGRLAVVDDAILMDGREGTARFLAPVDTAHAKVEAVVSIPGPDEPGRDDAWLLFDCLDQENGKFFGLVDGGRKLVMGVLEGGRPRILASVPVPEGTVLDGRSPDQKAAPDQKAKVRLGVVILDGLAVGRFEGKAVLKVNFDRGLGAARFGFLTHGIASVSSLAIQGFQGEDIHRMKLTVGGVVHLRKGNHTFDVELLAAGASLDSLTVKDLAE